MRFSCLHKHCLGPQPGPSGTSTLLFTRALWHRSSGTLHRCPSSSMFHVPGRLHRRQVCNSCSRRLSFGERRPCATELVHLRKQTVFSELTSSYSSGVAMCRCFRRSIRSIFWTILVRSPVTRRPKRVLAAPLP